MFPNGDGTDIWFTMGPESIDPEVVNRIIQAGATGVRLTFSYGTPSLQEQYSGIVRGAAKATDTECVVVADLAGEKIRLGEFGGHENIPVNKGDTIHLVTTEEGFDPDKPKIPVGSDEFLKKLKEGDRIVIGDGAVLMQVKQIKENFISAEIERGDNIERKRGIVVQDGDFEPSSLTKDDIQHLKYVAKSDSFDVVALSFVSESDEVKKAREIMSSEGHTLPIVSKIETPSGVENAEDIARESDAVMVARGDLALFLPWNELAKYTESIVHAAQNTGTEWIMATQIAEGLQHFAFPTRAEICDLSRWRNTGMDGVLLSHETAFGSDPAQAVESVRSILTANR